ncbi:hypothetical protein KIPB_007030 [Kipferlia bialata]|uniref:Uncharacterized protein n=1 Tax=Kipferlia bialata TaxID=797122 RepID=A0A9K3GKA2_9EUKA|nr:hypothetical protein KIPB_007030 [Kipferlia bialata]|eukprot:g7030.t1
MKRDNFPESSVLLSSCLFVRPQQRQGFILDPTVASSKWFLQIYTRLFAATCIGVLSTNPASPMTLTAAQLAVVRRWIADGKEQEKYIKSRAQHLQCIKMSSKLHLLPQALWGEYADNLKKHGSPKTAPTKEEAVRRQRGVWGSPNMERFFLDFVYYGGLGV